MNAVDVSYLRLLVASQAIGFLLDYSKVSADFGGSLPETKRCLFNVVLESGNPSERTTSPVNGPAITDNMRTVLWNCCHTCASHANTCQFFRFFNNTCSIFRGNSIPHGPGILVSSRCNNRYQIPVNFGVTNELVTTDYESMSSATVKSTDKKLSSLASASFDISRDISPSTQSFGDAARTSSSTTASTLIAADGFTTAAKKSSQPIPDGYTVTAPSLSVTATVMSDFPDKVSTLALPSEIVTSSTSSHMSADYPPTTTSSSFTKASLSGVLDNVSAVHISKETSMASTILSTPSDRTFFLTWSGMTSVA